MSKSNDDRVFHRTFHVKQSYSWDCGLACVRMLLSGLDNQTGDSVQDKMNKVLKTLWSKPETNFRKRPWTIDLCNILRCLNIDFTFYTTTCHVSLEDKGRIPFYKSGSVAQDKTRVDRLVDSFQIEVVEKALSLDDLVCLLQQGPLIILVDGNRLECLRCRGKEPFWSRMLSGVYSKKRGFAGHYILLLGYSRASKVFYFRDPAVTNDVCDIKAEALDHARLAHGTDQDTIAVEIRRGRTPA